MKIEKSIVEEEIETKEDIELYQNTTFKKNVNAWDISRKNEIWIL